MPLETPEWNKGFLTVLRSMDHKYLLQWSRATGKFRV